jgi:dTDP-4-amino-4,6-dideoxy-D-galactose acyltransferase
MVIKPLSWDSDFFQMKIGSLDLGAGTMIEEIWREGRAKNFDLIYGFMDSDTADINFPYEWKTYYMATNVVFRKSLTSSSEFADDNFIRQGIFPQDRAKLNALSIQAGHSSRFKIDRRFGDAKFRSLYKAWADNSLQKKIADIVFVHHEVEPEGFITVKLKGDLATIGLIAVDDRYRHRNIGGKLLHTAENYAVAYGCTSIEVGTQVENEGACRFYSKQGFAPNRFSKIFHFWL